MAAAWRSNLQSLGRIYSRVAAGGSDRHLLNTLEAAVPRGGPPSRSLADGVLVAGALQYHTSRHRVDQAEVDVELRAERDRRQVPEQVRPAGSRSVCRDR